jgi:hypothetical protein
MPLDPVRRAGAGPRRLPELPCYLHRYQLVEPYRFVPHADCLTLVPEWKRSDWAVDALPVADPARDPGAREVVGRWANAALLSCSESVSPSQIEHVAAAPGSRCDSCRGVTGHGGIPADRAQVIVRRVEKDDEPSQTALTAAAARAAHLVVDGSPKIFTDSLAAALLLDRADELLAYHRTHGGILFCPAPAPRSSPVAATQRTAWPRVSSGE